MDQAPAGHLSTETVTTAELLARLDSLTTRLDEQSARVAALEAENARLRATPGLQTGPRVPAARVGRRGLLRTALGVTAAATALAGAMAGGTAREAAATSGTGPDGNFVLGSNDSHTNYATLRTQLVPGLTFTGQSLLELNASPFQSAGSVDVIGVAGNSRRTACGVFGTNRIDLAYAASGFPAGLNAGVCGSGYGFDTVGVRGMAQYNVGVVGTSTYGDAIHGDATGGIGVQGTSTNGIGVYGFSTSNYGAGGTTRAVGYAGLFGYTDVPGASALLGISSPANGTAGYFHGAVFVDGSFQVLNGPKAALVAHPDGSHRRVYCQEAPEPWFEDFGTATLQGGKATVRLDPDFAAVVRTDDYEVFPVAKGECNGLYVASQMPTSFEVRELRAGTSNVAFSYRLVARRKDNVGRRLEKVDIPKMAPIDVDKLTRPAGPPRRDQ